MAKRAKPVRYYITCDDDRPVVHTIPVEIREDESTSDSASRAVLPPSIEKRTPEPTTRVARLVRSAVRRGPSGH